MSAILENYSEILSFYTIIASPDILTRVLRTFIKLRDKYFTHTIKSCDLFIEYVDNIFEKYGSEEDKEKIL